MEIFDVVDELGVPTGEKIERKKAHALGVRHRTAHTWILRKTDNTFQCLLQKRSVEKESFPGQYDTSSAGHILSGQEPLEAALRELKEELGVDASESDLKFVGTFKNEYAMEFHGSPFHDNEVSFVYVCLKEIDESKLVLQEEEVSGVAWSDIEELKRKLDPRDPLICVPRGGFDLIWRFVENEE